MQSGVLTLVAGGIMFFVMIIDAAAVDAGQRACKAMFPVRAAYRARAAVLNNDNTTTCHPPRHHLCADGVLERHRVDTRLQPHAVCCHLPRRRRACVAAGTSRAALRTIEKRYFATPPQCAPLPPRPPQLYVGVVLIGASRSMRAAAKAAAAAAAAAPKRPTLPQEPTAAAKREMFSPPEEDGEPSAPRPAFE